MSATASTIVAAAATAIGAGLPTWSRSPRPSPDSWPLDGQGIQHHQWSIAAERTEIVSGWRPTASGVPGEKVAQARTELRVRWAANLRPDAPHTDYTAALADLDNLFVALSGSALTGIGQIVPQDVVYTPIADRWLLTSAAFTCTHTLTLRS
jgi:hypothetical protein